MECNNTFLFLDAVAYLPGRLFDICLRIILKVSKIRFWCQHSLWIRIALLARYAKNIIVAHKIEKPFLHIYRLSICAYINNNYQTKMFGLNDCVHSKHGHTQCMRSKSWSKKCIATKIERRTKKLETWTERMHTESVLFLVGFCSATHFSLSLKKSERENNWSCYWNEIALNQNT